jgi:hypothetical protein
MSGFTRNSLGPLPINHLYTGPLLPLTLPHSPSRVLAIISFPDSLQIITPRNWYFTTKKGAAYAFERFVPNHKRYRFKIFRIYWHCGVPVVLFWFFVILFNVVVFSWYYIATRKMIFRKWRITKDVEL